MVVRKGKVFESETAALAGVSPKGVPYGKRIARSGAFGTTDGIPQLAGDARWMLPWLDSEIHLECKHGYDKGHKGKYCPTCGKVLDDKAKVQISKDQKSMTLYREWFTKHMTQAKALDFYPAFAFKFKFVKQNGMSKMIVIPFPVMERVINTVNNMHQEIDDLKRELVKWEKGLK